MRCSRCGTTRPDPLGPCPRCEATDAPSRSRSVPTFLVRYPDGHVRTDSGQPWNSAEEVPCPVLEAPHPWSTVLRPLWDYDLLQEVGRGSAGVVYRAWSLRLARICAVKTLGGRVAASTTELRRFQTEAMLAARLDHPSIVRVFDAGEDGGQPYLVMEFVEGGSFSSFLGRKDPQALQEGIRVLAEAARAIHHAHQHGIVHRDVKPDNILLDRQGYPHIGDFGLAITMDTGRGVSLQGHPLGTPWYMSPEQASGLRQEIGPSTDIYSLGATLYHLLAGRPPFTGSNVLAVLMDVLRRDPPDPEMVAARVLGRPVPRDLKAICQRAMEKNPARRYSTALALAEDLENWLSGRPVSVRPWTLRERWSRRIERHRETLTWVAVLLSAVLVTVSLFGSMLVVTTRRHQQELERLSRTALLEQVEAIDHALQVAMMEGHPDLIRNLLLRVGSAPGVSSLTVLRPDGSPADFGQAVPRPPDPTSGPPAGVPPEEWRRVVRNREVVISERRVPGEDPMLMALRPILNRPECRTCHDDHPDGEVLGVMVAERSQQGESRRIEATRKALWTLGLLLGATALSLIFTVARILGFSVSSRRNGGSRLSGRRSHRAPGT